MSTLSNRCDLQRQVMEYPAHDLPVTGLGFAPREAGVALGGYDLLAGSADYKITLFKSQGEGKTVGMLCLRCAWKDEIVFFFIGGVQSILSAWNKKRALQ